MLRLLTTIILLLSCSFPSYAEETTTPVRAAGQMAKPARQRFMLKLRLFELPPREEGMVQHKKAIVNQDMGCEESYGFSNFCGGEHPFKDSGESQRWGERIAGKVKLNGPEELIVDLKISLSAKYYEPEQVNDFLVQGEEIQLHSKMKLNELKVVKLKTVQGRPRWLELTVCPGGW